MRVGEKWYQGTADAVYQNLYSLLREHPRYVIVLAGDHIYKMDYRKMLQFHIDKGAHVTLASIEVPIQDGSRCGIVAVDDEQRVNGFQEKPLDPVAIPGMSQMALASMGVYVFDMDVIVRALEQDAADPGSQHDFGKNVIPALLGGGRVFSYSFYDENKKAAKYWRDIGTLDAYYEANMDLCQVNPEFNLYDPEWQLRTYQPQAPPAKFVFAEEGRRGDALDSLISPGCIVSGSRIWGSILCPNVRVHSFCAIEESILMPGVRVGRHAQIRRAIIDRDVLIPRGAVIGFDPEEDRKRHTVTDLGVVVVTEDDDPLVEPISDEALRIEAEDDGR
jgi:glucose-1-phosphate adenylyltransferase